MSRTGLKPLEVPRGVEVSVEGGLVGVKGPKGASELAIPSKIVVAVKDGVVTVSREDDSREAKSCHGLIRTLVRNMCQGVSEGFSKVLEIQGVGFNADASNDVLRLNLGYPSPVEFRVPEGVSVTVEGGTVLTVTGIDNQKVGDTAARIRSFYPAEPYKGKGIRYRGEQVRRKVGKKVA